MDLVTYTLTSRELTFFSRTNLVGGAWNEAHGEVGMGILQCWGTHLTHCQEWQIHRPTELSATDDIKGQVISGRKECPEWKRGLNGPAKTQHACAHMCSCMHACSCTVTGTQGWWAQAHFAFGEGLNFSVCIVSPLT